MPAAGTHHALLLSVAASAVGVLSHLFYFIYGEHHKDGLFLAKLLCCAPLLGAASMVIYWRYSIILAVQNSALLTTAYLAGLWASMTIYRVFFHRLRNFPGPSLARISKLYHVWMASDLTNCWRLDEWHKKYGNVVRVGPNELSITLPDAQTAIFLGSRCHKTSYYDGIAGPIRSLFAVRDAKLHETRRRVWDRAFSAKALRDYESRVTNYTYLLIDQLSAFSGQPVNAEKWFSYYSFDVMGDLAFGKSFNMLKTGETHFAIQLMHDGISPYSWLGQASWLLPIVGTIPALNSGLKSLAVFCAKQIDERKAMKVDLPDISTYLLESSEKASDPLATRRWLLGDSKLIIVAGSDTTTGLLTFIFYHLVHDPSQVDKLREELDGLWDRGKPFEVKYLHNAYHMDGVINEALRLHPPVPGGVFRTTPPEGIEIDGVYIPGNVDLRVPNYTMHRSEACFKQPNEFLPERWYSRPDLIINKNAFAPFGIGPYSCIGKQLALMEVRTVISLLITEFDISFAPGHEANSLINDTRDAFTWSLGELKLVFKKRPLP